MGLLSGRGERILYAPQNLVEFWRACTRPMSANGFGLSVVETNRRAKVIERLYSIQKSHGVELKKRGQMIE